MPTKSKRKLLHKLEHLRNQKISDIYTGRLQDKNRCEKNVSDELKNNETDLIEDPMELIKFIKSSNNHYEILHVNRHATIVEVKKAYRRLALRLHPDKNNAKDASEAFRIVTKSAEILTDESKRYDYNRQLDLEQRKIEFYENRHYNNRHTKNENPKSNKEDTYTPFNSYSFEHRRFYNLRHQHTIFTDAQLLTMGIVIAFIFAIVLAFLSFTNGSVYSLKASRKYCVQRKTEIYSIPYYVTKTFEKDFKGSVKNLEQNIEKHYIDTMKYSCRSEHSFRESLILRAKKFGNSAQLANAKVLQLPSCERLQKLELGLLT
ncbi:dnaJ homolog subfamily C member 18-like [Teleopsis dalmanni]|uniref:dnaJ homolog subfamily C member 18-like n=1 Tax=Teleopsis dalmanni TaxID=139649 RepID=UPI0018CDBAB8|nr:dnaJ homolog subfamily C member 18-like [Teleopsis dalmanni]